MPWNPPGGAGGGSWKEVGVGLSYAASHATISNRKEAWTRLMSWICSSAPHQGQTTKLRCNINMSIITAILYNLLHILFIINVVTLLSHL